MKKIVNILLVLLIFSSAFATYWALTNQFRLVKIASDSMEPAFRTGDTLLVKSIDTKSLKVGQIPILPSLTEKGIYYAHRVISRAKSTNNFLAVKTKGDANPIADDWKYSITSEKVPVFIGSIPTSDIPHFLNNFWFLAGLIFVLVSLPDYIKVFK